jgi:hypothetical protein
MRRGNLILMVAFWLAPAVPAQEKVNQNALVLQDFSKRVADYLEVHKTARSDVHGIKPTKSQQEISHYEHHLAERIRELRKGAAQGAIFTPEISAEFGRLIHLAMQGASAARVQQSLNHAEPVYLPRLRVNGPYPEGIPLQSTPPSFLLNLPKLPPEVEYRVVGHDLVLRDVDANLIVDLIPNVVP